MGCRQVAPTWSHGFEQNGLEALAHLIGRLKTADFPETGGGRQQRLIQGEKGEQQNVDCEINFQFKMI